MPSFDLPRRWLRRAGRLLSGTADVSVRQNTSTSSDSDTGLIYKSSVVTEHDWQACLEPFDLWFFVDESGDRKVGTQRFKWLALEWGRRVRHHFASPEALRFDSFTSWVKGADEHPNLMTFPEELSDWHALRHPLQFELQSFIGWILLDHPMAAAVHAGEAAIKGFPEPDNIWWNPANDLYWFSQKRRWTEHRQWAVTLKEWQREKAAHAARVSKEFCDQFRDVAGNPFRPVTAHSEWFTPTVQALGTGIDIEAAYDRLPILADALEEAGCDSAEMLRHCREPGTHVRGCWVIDMVLGRL